MADPVKPSRVVDPLVSTVAHAHADAQPDGQAKVTDSERLAWLLAWMEERGLLTKFAMVAQPNGKRGPAWVLRTPHIVGGFCAFGLEDGGPIGVLDVAIRTGNTT